LVMAISSRLRRRLSIRDLPQARKAERLGR
jgi:hypothetical protein